MDYLYIWLGHLYNLFSQSVYEDFGTYSVQIKLVHLYFFLSFFLWRNQYEIYWPCKHVGIHGEQMNSDARDL